VFERWRGGAAVALFVAAVLVVRFTVFAGAAYESRVVMELAPQSASSAPAPPLGPGALSQLLRDALPELDRKPRAGAPQRLLMAESNGQLLLACRAGQPHAAHQHCAQLAGEAVRKLPDLRVVQPATLPSQTLAAAPLTLALIWFGSLLMGVLGGSLWMLGLSLLPTGPRVRRSNAAPQPSAPASVATRARGRAAIEPEGSAGTVTPRLLTSRPEVLDAREHTSAASGARAPGSGPAAGDSRAARPIVSLDAAIDWSMDPSLDVAERPADLQRLCNQLYVAAAQRCLIVGVSSEARERAAKSRFSGQLAWLLSRSQHARVLLLELDLEFPSIDRVMRIDMPPRAGFSQQVHSLLRAGSEARSQAPWTVVRCTRHLSVLAEGRVRTPGMLQAQPIGSAVASLRHHFDIIVADGPTCEIDADRRSFGDAVDGVLFVAPSSAADEQAVAIAAQHFGEQQLLAVVAMSETG
jgi:Mrp family chromosome partitioning ATPase